MSRIPSRNNWQFFKDYTSDDSELTIGELINYYTGLMFNRTLQMFEWKNLPDNMTSYDFEKFTQMNGKTIFLKDGERFYILDGAPFNDITWNYEPSEALVVNPALPKLKNQYTLGKDAVLLRNDYLMLGLGGIFEKNSIDLANTDISIRFAMFNIRFKSLMVTDDDNGKESIDKLMKDLWQGKKPYSVVTPNLYKSKPNDSLPYSTNQNSDIKDLMELKQYQLAHFFIELCINANYNMKRENIGKSEATLMNEDVILPLIDQMLEMRQKFCIEANKLFNLNMSVDLSSAWKKIQEEVEADIEKVEADVKLVEKQAEEPLEPEKDGDNDDTKETE